MFQQNCNGLSLSLTEYDPKLPLWGWANPFTTNMCLNCLSVGQLSLAVPTWAGAMSTNREVVMLCSWGVNASRDIEWVAGKTVD